MATDVERLIREIQALPPQDRTRVRQALEAASAAASSEEGRAAETALQQRLVETGLVTQLRRPLRDAKAFARRNPVDVKGKPLSETIIEERR